MDLELFTVVLNGEGTIELKFSDDIKKSLSINEIENLLKDDVQEHLSPIITKLIQAAF
ncbi:hypothetical protein HYH38_16140 [Clostridium botulinum]|uniref:hypothetical protein n=1 Tax=Clostridium botulinum TaxID=1491 RepID=UPI00155D91BE|nr:hypothetical protein [Clostridium botulinum]MBY6810994.1 hypothetical protein [Clostridium botulinum]MBY6818471.1 hypothetical protein [Clostridium botulinum]MBY6824462.1 hypothetical protein [Clostridium botulinum]MBY6828765.1 hypothetical protein [Clostridium botulinum]MBY6832694.1 hypothetical protein [Clostridium botulinum]